MDNIYNDIESFETNDLERTMRIIARFLTSNPDHLYNYDYYIGKVENIKLFVNKFHRLKELEKKLVDRLNIKSQSDYCDEINLNDLLVIKYDTIERCWSGCNSLCNDKNEINPSLNFDLNKITIAISVLRPENSIRRTYFVNMNDDSSIDKFLASLEKLYNERKPV